MKNITVTFAAQTVRVLQLGPAVIFKCVLVIPLPSRKHNDSP